MTIIKNCGLKSVLELEQAVATGASFVGFVHYPASPRHLGIPEIAALNLQKPDRLKSVVVMVAPSDQLIDDITSILKPDFLQIHKVDAPRAAMISERSRIPLILGVAMRDAADVALAHSLEPIAAHVLLDAPESGSGSSFDWGVLAGIHFSKLWFLAGGLNAANVRDAIRVTGAPMVDVSSGIEDKLGQKSLEKIAAFNRAVLHPTHG